MHSMATGALLDFDRVFNGTVDALDSFVEGTTMSDAQHVNLCQKGRALVLSLVTLSQSYVHPGVKSESQRMVAEFNAELQAMQFAFGKHAGRKEFAVKIG